MNPRNVAKHARNGNWPMAAVECLPERLFQLVYNVNIAPGKLYRDSGGLWVLSPYEEESWYLPRAVDALRITHVGDAPRRRVADKYVGRSPWRLEDIGTVVDVGAYIGELHRFGFDGIAIEPDRRNYRCCTRNVPDDVAVVNAAAWYEDAIVDFGEDPDGSESRVHGDAAHRIATRSIPARTVSSIVAASDEYDADDIDLVKIDAEGYEPEVLAGAVRLRTRLAVDVSAERHGESTEGLCRAVLASAGYTAERRGDVLYAR